jgi:hypothetical protein
MQCNELFGFSSVYYYSSPPFFFLTSTTSTTFHPFSQMKPESLRVSSRTARALEMTDDNERTTPSWTFFCFVKDRPEK